MSKLQDAPPRQENPLFKWRKENHTTRIQAAGLLELGAVSTIYYWETGSTYPRDHHFERIAALMGIDLKKLRRAWDRWLYTHD